MVARKTENLSAIRDTVARIRSGEIDDLSQIDFTELVNVEELAIDDIEPLRAELDSFIDAVRGNSKPEVPAEDGLAAVELATQIVVSRPAEITGSGSTVTRTVSTAEHFALLLTVAM